MAVKVKQAVIMVGGKGTRLRPLTDNCPKPILPVLDKPCLKYLIESFARGGITEIILACGYRSELMAESIGDGSDLGISIEYSYEDKPMGTGGAIKLLEDRLDETFVAANGDVFADIDLEDEIAEHFDSEAAVTIALTPVDNPCEFGIARQDETGRIEEFKEKPKPEEVFSNLINAGVYIIQKEVLKYIPEGKPYDFSKDLVPQIMKDGYKIQGHVISGVWKDVGRPSDLMGANVVMANREYKDYAWGGSRAHDSEMSKPFYLGDESTIIESTAKATIISAHCNVNNSHLSNVLLFPGCSIIASSIENSILGKGCKINDAKITNSVLADNSIVEPGTTIENNERV